MGHLRPDLDHPWLTQEDDGCGENKQNRFGNQTASIAVVLKGAESKKLEGMEDFSRYTRLPEAHERMQGKG